MDQERWERLDGPTGCHQCALANTGHLTDPRLDQTPSPPAQPATRRSTQQALRRDVRKETSAADCTAHILIKNTALYVLIHFFYVTNYILKCHISFRFAAATASIDKPNHDEVQRNTEALEGYIRSNDNHNPFYRTLFFLDLISLLLK